MLCTSLSVQSGHRGLWIHIGRHLQNKALTFGFTGFRCVVLLHSADEGSEKRVLRCACFSEIMRTSLIASMHLYHFDTLTNNSCFERLHSADPCGLLRAVMCVSVVGRFAFLHVGEDTLFSSKCTHKQICAIAVILCQLSRIII